MVRIDLFLEHPKRSIHNCENCLNLKESNQYSAIQQGAKLETVCNLNHWFQYKGCVAYPLLVIHLSPTEQNHAIIYYTATIVKRHSWCTTTSPKEDVIIIGDRLTCNYQKLKLL